MSSLINTSAYDYVDVLGKAADASWLRNECIADNLANDDTPGYKRKDVDFEDALKKAMGSSRYKSTDDKVSSLKNDDLTPKVYTDASAYSYREDGNNVDEDTENVYLAKNQIRYNGLIQSMDQEFKNLKMVTK